MNANMSEACAEAVTPPLKGGAMEGCRAEESQPRILLIAQKGLARDRYRRDIRRTGARVDTAASIGDVQGAVTQSAYNGIVIDIPTKIQAMSRHKDLVSSILDRFPVIQVNQEKTSGRIRALLYGRHTRHGDLHELIRDNCLTSPPLRLRTRKRYDLHFNLLMATSRRFASTETERTVTLNVSPDGCFIFSTARFRQGQRVWVRIMELDDKTPIACDVIHKRQWGAEMEIPGIGVRFISMTEAQTRALSELCARSLKTERTVSLS